MLRNVKSLIFMNWLIIQTYKKLILNIQLNMNLSVFIAHALKELGYFQIKNAAYITQIITQTNIFFIQNLSVNLFPHTKT